MAESSTLQEIGRKVFLFTAPRFETNRNPLRKGEVKRKCFAWKISQFDLDLRSNATKSSKRSEFSTTKRCSDPYVQREDSQEISEINLEYDVEDIRDSILVYLDNTFSENSQLVEATEEFTSHTCNEGTNGCSDGWTSEACKNRVQQEYEDALQQSQELLRENQGSIEMSSNESRRCLPESISQNSLNQTDVLSTDSSDSRTARQSLSPAKKMDMWFITKLSSCTEHLSKVNIFAVVLQVNPIKEIHIKSGIKSGQFVRVSSILIGDSTKEYFKLTLWERAADWVMSLVDGDVVVVKKVKIEKWQNEFYGQSMCDTVLVNLQRGNSTKIPPHWLTLVSKNEARSLMNWLNFRHPYLAVHQPWVPCTEVKWQTLPQLKANSLIHYRAKIVKVLTYNNVRGNYLFGLKKVNKVMAIASDMETSEELPIYLWGNQADWQYELKARIGQMWDFKYLRVECRDVHGDFTLHTTPQSTKLLTQPSLIHIVPTQEEESSVFPCISVLLKANCTGKVSVSANITNISIERALADMNSVLNIDKTSDSETVQQFFKQLVYLGCRSCLQALKQDHNHVYTHCSHCLNHPSNYRFGVIYCYKQCRICFSDSSASIIAMSFHRSTIKLIRDFDPQDVLEGTKTNELFDFCSSIFHINYQPIVSLYCESKLDENGYVEKQTFELVDIHV